MCNEAARRTALGLMREDFSQLKIPLRFPEGLPNLKEVPSIRITDTTVIVRAAAGDANRGTAEMVTRRWSWPGTNGKPVYNFRSEGRTFGNLVAPGPGGGIATGGRCLIPLDAFFEFTESGTVADGADALTLPWHGQWAPPAPATAGEGKKGRKDKWAFAAADGRFLGVAGLWRSGVVPPLQAVGPGVPTHVGEAFTMLTCAPGPDIAPYHSRQIVLMPRDRWADWLGVGDRGVVPAAELIAPTPAGTLVVTRVR